MQALLIARAAAASLAVSLALAAPAHGAQDCRQLLETQDYRAALAAAARAAGVEQRICGARALIRLNRQEDALAVLHETRTQARSIAQQFALENATGMANAHLGRAAAARAAHNRALDLARELRDPELVGASLANLALGYEQAEPMVARLLLAESLRLAPSNAVAMMTLASMHEGAREYDAARALLVRAVALTRRGGNQALRASALIQLADVERTLGRHAAAIDAAHDALLIAYARQDRAGEALALELLADVYIDQRMPDEAFIHGFGAMAARFAVGDELANQRIADRMKQAFER